MEISCIINYMVYICLILLIIVFIIILIKRRKNRTIAYRKIKNIFCSVSSNKEEKRIEKYVALLVCNAIWAVGFVIELTTDVLSWINDKLEELQCKGTTEVNIIQGSTLSQFIQQKQSAGKYTEISVNDLNAMRNSVVNVAMDAQENITDDQMIRSEGGLSSQLQAKFNGQPILKIKI